MTRRKSKLSIFQWFYHHLIIAFGLVSQKQRTRGNSIKRCNRRVSSSLRKHRVHHKAVDISFPLNNNSKDFSSIDPQRMVCILVENEEIAQWIEREKIPMFDLQEFLQLSTKRSSQDASTMTNTGTDSIDQSERLSRLKSLELIRLFLERTEDDFCQYLIEQEHFSRAKSLTIYQMIKQFLFI